VDSYKLHRTAPDSAGNPQSTNLVILYKVMPEKSPLSSAAFYTFYCWHSQGWGWLVLPEEPGLYAGCLWCWPLMEYPCQSIKLQPISWDTVNIALENLLSACAALGAEAVGSPTSVAAWKLHRSISWRKKGLSFRYYSLLKQIIYRQKSILRGSFLIRNV